MRTPSPTSEDSRSSAAAALLELAQTPEQKATIQRDTLSTPGSLERHVHVFSSPASESFGVTKLSNSDDEDTVASKRTVFRDTNNDQIDAPRMSHKALRLEDQSRQFRANSVVPSTNAPETAITYGLAVMRRPNTAPIDRSPYTTAEDVREMRFPSVAEPSYPDLYGVGTPGRTMEQAPPMAPSPLLTGPDDLDSFLRQLPSSNQHGFGVPTPFHLTSETPHKTSPRPLPFKGATMGPRHVSQPPPQFQYMLPPANTNAKEPPSGHEPLPSAGEVRPLSNLYGLPVPGSGFSEGAGGRSKVQIPRAMSKRAVAPPKIPVAKSPRDGFGPKEIDISDFRYRTIKAITMPVRKDLILGQDPPEPTPESRPYGNDIDYRASLLIWWCDDLELSYSETTRRYRLKFPSEKTITEDTIRKKHTRYLEKLARRHGLKPQDDVEEPGPSILRRGRQAGHQHNTINGMSVYAAGAESDVAGTVRRRRRVTEPTHHKGMLKACICVWKDTSDVSFEQIQQRLEHEYNWLVGVNTVQKMYYAERARVYNTYDKTGALPHQQSPSNMADITVSDLRAYYQQRERYLLMTFSQQIPQQDVVQMQLLSQLIGNMEHARLQQAQKTGRSRTSMNQVVTADELKIEEVIVAVEEEDTVMQDAAEGDSGFAGNQRVD